MDYTAIRKRAKEAADFVLERFWDDSLPVDPVQIARRVGITVKRAKLDPTISGLIAKTKGRDPIIMFSADDSTNRSRFTVAHELGHFFDKPMEEEIDYVDYRKPSGQSDEHEIFANEFAGCLLMPEAKVMEVRERLGIKGIPSGFDAWTISDEFQVSTDAMRYRIDRMNRDSARSGESK